MSTTNIDKLNDLLEKNYDAEKGYKQAAEHAKDTNLKKFFDTYIAQRYTFGHDIKGELKNLDAKINASGSMTGALHRTWLNTKAFVAGSTDEAIIEECIRGEKAAAEEYEEALKREDIPASTESILRNHLNAINEAIISLKELEVAFQD